MGNVGVDTLKISTEAHFEVILSSFLANFWLIVKSSFWGRFGVVPTSFLAHLWLVSWEPNFFAWKVSRLLACQNLFESG